MWIGGGEPVSVQSMTKTFTSDIKATIKQIKQLENAGCQIVRCAVPDMASAQALKKIKKSISIPLVADIHFDYRLALEAIKSGVDKLRINPGNIGNNEKIKQVVRAAKSAGIPIRIGVNSGSLEKDILQKHGAVTAQALVDSAMRHVEILESLNFKDIVISVKAASVPLNICAYKLLSEKTNYPLHIGITEAGPPGSGTIKSAVGIGAMLAMGIGDTLRVSLSGNPLEEVKAGIQILKALELYDKGVNIISCPTCGRCEIDVAKIARQVEEKTRSITKPIKIAIMGCVVNGPGEAKEADIGLAGSKKTGLIFVKGKAVRQVKENQMVQALLEEVKKYD